MNCDRINGIYNVTMARNVNLVWKIQTEQSQIFYNSYHVQDADIFSSQALLHILLSSLAMVCIFVRPDYKKVSAFILGNRRWGRRLCERYLGAHKACVLVSQASFRRVAEI